MARYTGLPVPLHFFETMSMQYSRFALIVVVTLLTSRFAQAQAPSFFRAGGGIAADDASPLPAKIEARRPCSGGLPFRRDIRLPAWPETAST